MSRIPAAFIPVAKREEVGAIVLAISTVIPRSGRISGLPGVWSEDPVTCE